MNAQAEVARRMAEAAQELADSFDEDQASKAHWPFEEATDRQNWHYVPRVRACLSKRWTGASGAWPTA